MARRIIDLSHDLSADSPVYPGDPPTEITSMDSTEWQKPDGPRALNCGRIAIGLHCGTHMDAPFHFFGHEPTIEQIPLEHCTGPALCIDLPNFAPGAPIGPEKFAPYANALRKTGKVLLNTGWHRRWREQDYFSAHPVLTGEAAQFLVEAGVHLIGVDFPSVDLPPYPAHIVFLSNHVLIIENLTNLDAINAQRFELIAAPLKIVGRDGSPVRAIAILSGED